VLLVDVVVVLVVLEDEVDVEVDVVLVVELVVELLVADDVEVVVDVDVDVVAVVVGVVDWDVVGVVIWQLANVPSKNESIAWFSSPANVVACGPEACGGVGRSWQTRKWTRKETLNTAGSASWPDVYSCIIPAITSDVRARCSLVASAGSATTLVVTTSASAPGPPSPSPGVSPAEQTYIASSPGAASEHARSSWLRWDTALEQSWSLSTCR
jgi:hypothetical protein